MAITDLQPDIQKFVDAFGRKRVPTILEKLGKGKQFIQAINHPISQELLKSILARWNDLLAKVFSSTASDEEKMEFNVIDGLLTSWATKIIDIMTYESQILEGTTKE